MRYNAFPTRPIGSFALYPQQGTGHVSPSMNTRFCAHCQVNKPSEGGHYRGPLFLCNLHRKPEVLV